MPEEGEASPRPEDAERFLDQFAGLILNADFEAWLATLDGRRREIAEQLASGLNTADVGRLRGVTRAAIHWVRKDLIASWEELHRQGGQSLPDV